MATILGMKRRFESFDAAAMITKVMHDSTQDLRDLNLEQMYDGKTNKGTDIKPSYIEDPYWNDKGGVRAAQAYSDWKDRITPNIRRTPGTPNLFITGFYHSTIKVSIVGDSIVHSSTFSGEPDIRGRFKNIYGLGGRHREIFLKQYLMPVIKDEVLNQTGLLMK